MLNTYQRWDLSEKKENKGKKHWGKFADTNFLIAKVGVNKWLISYLKKNELVVHVNPFSVDAYLGNLLSRVNERCLSQFKITLIRNSNAFVTDNICHPTTCTSVVVLRKHHMCLSQTSKKRTWRMARRESPTYTRVSTEIKWYIIYDLADHGLL